MSELNRVEIGETFYKQSANTLFHFMPRFQYLTEAIKMMSLFSRFVEEEVSYLNLEISKQSIKKVAFPMLCFCDINLHNIHHHVEGKTGYGKYGFGLNKEWCEQSGVQPIRYVNESSKETEGFSKIFNSGLESLQVEEYSQMEFFDYILDLLKHTKPLKGSMEKNKEYITKNFHDEKEWRFVPNLENLIENDFYNDATMPEYMNFSVRNELSDSLKIIPESLFKLEIDVINYIFVENEKDRSELLDLIDCEFEGKDKLEMASKILVYNQIKKDW